MFDHGKVNPSHPGHDCDRHLVVRLHGGARTVIEGGKTGQLGLPEPMPMAQVHAILALAAAAGTASPADGRSWAEVAGTELSG